MNEQQLLHHYLNEHSEEAFREIVSRNTDLVYGAARRQLTGSAAAEMADEITQAVFIVLARKAASVRGPVAGWLIRTTYFACKAARRMAQQREFHERRAMELKMQHALSDKTPAWEAYAPVLDQSLMELGQKDRDALILRYFKGMQLRDIGHTQGISEDAARKRVDRALQRLRGTMLRKTAVPGVALLASALAARAAEAAPANLLLPLQLLHAAPAAPSLAIAKATTSIIAWIQFKIAAALVLATLITLTATAAWAHFIHERPRQTPQTFPIAEKTPLEMQPTDKVQLAQWHVILEEEELPILAQLGKSVTTNSILYDARIVGSAALRRAVITAKQNGTLAWTSRQMYIASSWDFTHSPSVSRNLSFDGTDNGTHVMIMGAATSGDETYKRVAQDRLSLKLDHNDMHADINERTNQWRWAQDKQKRAIVFDGEILAGDALVFIGKYVAASGRAYYQLVVWETFIAPDEVISDLRLQRDTAWWCEHGPAPLQQWANDARVWNAAALHDMDTVPPGFEKKLDDGKTVRLLAFSRPSQWPWCWWDANAQPIKGPDGMIGLDGDPPEGLWAAVTVSGSKAETKMRGPAAPGTPAGDAYNEMDCKAIPDADEFQVGFLVGPWKELGTLQVGTSATFDGVDYRIDRPSSLGPSSFLIHYLWTRLPDDDVCLVAVDRDGKEFEGNHPTTIAFGRNADTRQVEDYPNFYDITFDNVIQFKLMHRKRQWVTFANFARHPQTPPQTHVTLTMAVAAEAARHERLLTESLNDLAAKRQAWNAIIPDQTTERGLMKLMFDAIHKADPVSLRALMNANDSPSRQLADDMTRYLIDQDAFYRLAIQRFSERTLVDKVGPYGSIFLRDMEFEIMEAPVKISEDGSVEINDMPLRKNAAGKYEIDVPAFRMKAPDIGPSLRSMHNMIERVQHQLTENKTLPLDQLLESLEKNNP